MSAPPYGFSWIIWVVIAIIVIIVIFALLRFLLALVAIGPIAFADNSPEQLIIQTLIIR